MESCVVEAFTKTAVDEANREKGEPRSHSEVVVAFTFWLKLVVGDHANVPESVPQVITPFVSALRSQFAEFKAETIKLVVLAVVAVMAVVLAEGEGGGHELG